MDEREVNITKREKDVLLLLAKGLNVNEIAEELGLSTNTIESVKSHMMTKHRVKTSAGLMGVTVESWSGCKC